MTAPSNPPFTIGLLQFKSTGGREGNFEKATNMLREAATRGVQVACLPELFLSDYFCQSEHIDTFNLAEPIPGEATDRLNATAKALGITIVSSLFERRAAGVYHNTAVVHEAGNMLGMYRKMHIPDDPQFYEKYYFTPGDLGFKNFDTQVGRIGTLVCWDQWYPEAARLTAMQGASVIFYPTAIGWLPADKPELGDTLYYAWQTAQRAHAIANGCYIAACNRIGFEKNPTFPPSVPPASGGDERGGLEFWGGSFVADPYGRVVVEASRDKEEIVIAKVDPAFMETTRRNWPFFRDRRIDAYGDITKRFL